MGMRLITLGTGDREGTSRDRHPTHFALVGESGKVVLVDCGVCPLQGLRKKGIGADKVEAVVLTSTEPPEMAGLPLFVTRLKSMHEAGYPLKERLSIYGPERTIAQVVWQFSAWPRLRDYVTLHHIPAKGCDASFETTDFGVRAHPLTAGSAYLGLRFSDKHSKFVLTYGSLGGPTEVERLASPDTDVLVWGAHGGQDRLEEAIKTADELDVKSLVLVHVNEFLEEGVWDSEHPGYFRAEDGDEFVWNANGAFRRKTKIAQGAIPFPRSQANVS